MDISETPMCEDHPNVPAEVLCLKHRQFVCMTCAVEEKKHVTKKCDSKPIRNLTSDDELKLIALLAMKRGIVDKKRQLERHIMQTDSKKAELKSKVEKFKAEVNNEIHTKFELSLKATDDKAYAIQENNNSRMEKIDKVNAMFDAEIERLATKKSKYSRGEEESKFSALKANARNLPFTDLRISDDFIPNKNLKDTLLHLPSLGDVLLFEDDELYDQTSENSYLKPITMKTKLDEKNTKITSELYEDLNVKDNVDKVYKNLEVKTDAAYGAYKNLSMESSRDKKKTTDRKSLPLPEIPSAQKYGNISGKDASYVKLNVAIQPAKEPVKSQISKNIYANESTTASNRTKSPTSPDPKPLIQKTSNTEHVAGHSEASLQKTGGHRQSKEIPRRSNSLLEKFFGDNPEVMSANAVQKSSAFSEVKNKLIRISSRTNVTRRITQLTMLSSDRVVLLDEHNSTILLVKNGTIISEQRGEGFMGIVGNGRDTVAVLGRGKSLQITTYMAMGERKLEQQSCTKVEANIPDVSGFDFNSESGEYAISGCDRVIIISESGKMKKAVPFSKCLKGKESARDLKIIYDFETDNIYVLNTAIKSLRRFDSEKEQVKWDSKIENGQFAPTGISKGQKMIYISYHDCIKVVTIESGKFGNPVNTKAVLDDILGLYVDEPKGIGLVSSGVDTLEGSNMFAIVAV